MPTRVFLCWSGSRSRKFAEALRDWLPSTLGDTVETSMSTQIEKGAEWFEELLKALDNAACGILCLTPEAMESRWVHFESGLLVRALTQLPQTQPDGGQTTRVFPVLYGVQSGTLAGPLASYQSTVVTDADDVMRLLDAIYNFVPEDQRGGMNDLRKEWRRRWTTLQNTLAGIPAVPLKDVLPDFEDLFRRKTFQERMHDCLSQDWIARYNGARDTQLTLKKHADTVRKACRPFIADVFDDLVSALDSYAMGLSKLVGRPESPIDASTGEVVFESPGLATACERQRMRIRRLASRLVDERLAPILDEAFRFEAAETFEEKKRLIHRKTADLDKYQMVIKGGADSDWDFDRIMYYVWQTDREVNVEDGIYRTRLELERVNAKTAGWSLMPLSYSLGPLEQAVSQVAPTDDSSGRAQMSLLANDVRAFIERTHTDTGAQVRSALTRIEKILQDRAGP
jgi:hypothetical protein